MMIPLKIPTDLEILSTIYKLYYKDFVSYNQNKDIRETKMYVPIDCQKIADELKVDGDIVFFRLYSHLEKKYSYRQKDDSLILFFAYNEIPGNPRSINFPLMTSVLADLREEKDKFETMVLATILVAIVPLISIIVPA